MCAPWEAVDRMLLFLAVICGTVVVCGANNDFDKADLPLCRDNQHTSGLWVPYNKTRKDFYCCGYDEKDHRHDIEKCGGITLSGLEEHWGWNNLQAQSGGNACVCDKREGRTSVNPRERYLWRPQHCHLLSWNATVFCELLGNRTIVFIGDSTVSQSGHALMSMVYEGRGGCADKIAVTRSKHYIFRDFSGKLLSLKPDIAIVNHGAHASDYSGGIARDMNTVINNLREQLQSYQQNSDRKNVTIVWRTNHPGHVHCDNYTAPAVFQHWDQGIDWYSWSRFPEWDEIGKNFAREVGWKVVDLSPLYTRHDAHPGNGDCLHFCQPGPINLIGQLLLQMLHNNEI